MGLLRLYALAVAAGVAVSVITYQSIKQSGRVEGRSQERARVEKAEDRTDAKIKKARAAVATKPASGVLDKWSRD